MRPSYLMGLDAGGGSARCLLVELDSGAVTTAVRRWTHHPAPGTGGWGFDLELERCWSLLAEAAREAMGRARAQPDQVVAVAATSMRHALVLLDRHGRPILATPNRDRRAAAEGLQLAEEHGDEIHRRTGHWPSPIFAAARLRWLAGQSPGSLGRARYLLSLDEWLAYRMCGQVAAGPSQAGETLLFDLESRAWAWDLIDRMGLPQDIFPPLRQAGDQLGQLSDDAADALGLKPGTPVAVGGADAQCGLLGCGVLAAGQMGAIAGTTTPVQVVVGRPLVDPQARTWTGHHLVPGLWVVESNAGAMGEAVDWIASAMYADVPHPTSQLLEEAGTSVPGAMGVLSTVGADVMNARDMTLPIGNLTLTHLIAVPDAEKRRHVARAVLEGMAYALRANVLQLQSVTGVDAAELRIAGGMSQSATWTQIVADVLGGPVTVPSAPQASALGAAICAGVGAGVFPGLAQGTETLVRIERQHSPDPDRARAYRRLYGGWQKLRESRLEADQVAANLARLYSLASEEVGGPGDLTAPIVERDAAPPSPPGEEAARREELLRVVEELYTVGCITATGGNVSVRSSVPGRILITPTRLFKGELCAELLVRIDLEGRALDEGAPSPSSEWPMHCAVYRARSDVQAVVHAHAPQANILALSELPFLPVSAEAAFLGDIPRVPFVMPGTKELASAVVEALAGGSAVLMQNHGLLVAASSLRRAADLVEIIERTAEVIVGCYAVGREPPTLPEGVVATLREIGRLMA